MVSTHQQYLCPDYLNPSPPATMESSPLALLAQTCNSIGLPDGIGVNGTSKSAKHDTSKSSDSTNKSTTKDDLISNKTGSIRKTTTSAADSSSDSSSILGPITRSSPASKDASGTRSPESGRKSENKSRNAAQSGSVTSSETNRKSSEPCIGDAKSDSTVPITSTASTSSNASVSTSALLMNKCANINPLSSFPTSAFPPGLFPPYFPSNATSSTAFPYGAPHMSSLAFASGSCFPPFQSLPTANPWLTPPFPGFTPKCTDPFCKTCPAIAAAAVRGCGSTLGCPCIQCGTGHSANDLPLWLSSYGSVLGQTFGLHGTTAPMVSNPASIYAAAVAQQQANSTSITSTSTSNGGSANQSQQHVCSWMTGNEFCGKRFSSSEELLQHLRSHTSQDSATAASAHSAASLSIPAVVTSSGMAAHLSTAGRLSPRSTYLSSLNSLRYHPYAKFTPSTATANAALASLPFPPSAINPNATAFNPLSAFCSTLTAQRLPASLPHP